MTGVPSIDPRDGATIEIVAEETGTSRVGEICAAAHAAAEPLAEMARAGRATLLDDLAAALEANRERIVETADRETALGPGRLDGELTRTCYQLRLFGEVLRDGGYLEATIDHAADTPMGPRPDLRRMLVPIGPVAVFGASNFPLAFSVPGGDTASAIAAGSPVVLKAHHSHPATAQLCYEILTAAAQKSGAPDGTFGIVHGLRAGTDLVAHPAIRAVGFTGSVNAARALLAVIESRPEPIPFFGELSSLNPVVVTPAAAVDRAVRIGTEFAASFTLGAGQFCTKPGLLFVPTGPEGDQIVTTIQSAIAELPPMVLLNPGIAAAYQHGTASLTTALGAAGSTASSTAPLVTADSAVSPAVPPTASGGTTSPAVPPTASGGTPAGNDDSPGQAGGPPTGQSLTAAPRLLTAEAGALPPEATEECFGPVAVVARWTDETELFTAIDSLPSSLTATVHRGPGETMLPAELSRHFLPRTGRLIYDGYPTGVAVAWAQHHGGPWPST
ncbi:MAG TPA: aldehyde dehydrogenase family protein, partial [Actinoplanes sp.]|nr:aldehyde dehydrogenase family protein [Actinoplanes sp.]